MTLDLGPAPIVTEPGPAYRYRNADLEVLHTTSAPSNDTQALHYFNLVQDWMKDERVVFIEKREAGETKYHFMQFEFDGKEVKSLDH